MVVFVFLAAPLLSCLSWFVCVCFFLAASKPVRLADMRDYCRHVMRAGAVVHGCSFLCSALPVVFIFLFFLFLSCNIEGRQ